MTKQGYVGIEKGLFAAEREMLRVTEDGQLAQTLHPEVFGEKLENPYITTDFAESQVEVITPVFNTVKEVHDFLEALYDMVAMEIGDEYLWPQSMPCLVPDDQEIKISSFCQCEIGEEAKAYREHLMKKYGGSRQLISGIHFNFSFPEDVLTRLYKERDEEVDYSTFKNQLYLKMTRNYLRYRWVVVDLLGSTSLIHESYNKECAEHLSSLSKGTYTNDVAISFRNSDCGYQNQDSLYPNYESVDGYIQSVEQFIREGKLENHKELYSEIRLKPKQSKDFLQSLKKDGIQYVEIRNIDINPFSKAGIQTEELDFLHLFLLYCLLKEEHLYENWQEEGSTNQQKVAKFGQEKNLKLLRNGLEISMTVWLQEIFSELQTINEDFNLNKEATLSFIKERIEDVTKTNAFRIKELVQQKGYVQGHVQLAKAYKQSSYQNRFKFVGYEDMELSTQIVIKEAIKRGIRVEVMDREDNFITLEKYGKFEYVKQATKTSKDKYVNVLIMENKTMTKKVLHKKGIHVPMGMEFHSLEAFLQQWWQFEEKGIVIKPKSTNFGIGISIFPERATEEDAREAYALAAKHDTTVLVEPFIPGKEYRFLVIGDEVAGILHRVPANVRGDGIRTIRELVAEKNKSSLRGKGYKTPLEKIQLDENVALFLKQQGRTFDTVPDLEEVVYLRENSNISTGGDSIDYTDHIPERFKEIAIEATKAVGAVICGVDMMIEHEGDEDSPYSIIELNFNPAIHIHCFPYKGTERNIGEKVLKLLF